MNGEDCWLYEKSAAIEKIADNVTYTGLQWGDIKCLKMEECTVSAETSCQNKIMSKDKFLYLLDK